MAESSLDSLRQVREVEVDWRAYELHPDNAPAIPPEVEAHYRERVAAGWPRVQQIARERFGLEMRRMEGEGGRRSTRLAHVGAKYAIAQGRGEAYHKAAFAAHWQALRDISDVETLAALARQVGRDEAGFRVALSDPEYVSQVEEDEYWAWQQQLQGVPAFIFGGRYLVSGAQPPDLLAEVVDRCLAEGRAP